MKPAEASAEQESVKSRGRTQTPEVHRAVPSKDPSLRFLVVSHAKQTSPLHF